MPEPPRLSVDRIADAARRIDPVLLDTPQFASDTLSRELGLELVCKVETLNPIRSFKGRGADYYVSGLPDDVRGIVCASAGNFGQGIAFAARKRGIAVDVFASLTANPLKVRRMAELGARIYRSGHDFDAAKLAAAEHARRTGAHFVEDGREPAISEGAGTIAVELCSLSAPLDAVVMPLGNGALLAGVGCWLKAHRPQTQVIGVCAAAAPAMERSWRAGRVVTTVTAETIADGIAVRIPVPEALVELGGSVDDVVLVDEAEIVEAMRCAHRELGVVVEPAGAIGLAAAKRYRDRLAGARVATLLSGGNLTPEQAAQWLCVGPVSA
jgi:threonine dehydratase